MAFSGCSKLTTIDISSATTILDVAFYRCSSLQIESFSENLSYIGDSAFRRCGSVPDTINLPNLTYLGNAAFAEVQSIVNVVNLGTITTLGYGSDGYGWGPFYDCSNIETLIIPETVTTIGWSVGDGNKMRWAKILSTSIPTLLSWQVFGVEYRNSDPTSDYLGLSYPIYVKDDLLSQYKEADGWKYTPSSRFKPLSQFATDFQNG